jgi:hypothetical protein
LKTACKIVEDFLHALGPVISGADAVADQLRHPHADADGHVLKVEQLEESVIPNLQAILFVEHAQAVRHVVERDVEAIGLLFEAGRERRLFARHRQRLNDDVADAERDVDHSINEHQDDEAESPVDPVRVDKQRDRHR